MAIYNAGYLSPIRKKLGNAVGRKWRNLDVLAVYQPFVSNPNTAAQQSVRNHFATLAQFARYFAQAVEIGFLNICKGTKVPQRSMFIKKNWDAIEMTDPETASVNWDDIIVAEGALPEVSFGSPTFTEPLQVAVTMSSTEGVPGSDQADKVYLMVYSSEAKAAIISDGRNTRANNSLSVNVPAAWNGHRVRVWGFAVGAGIDNMGIISNSSYLGDGTIS